MTESTILIGVDDSERSGDAIAFGGALAAAADAQVIVACAFPYSRAYGYAALRDAALDTAYAMSRRLEGVPAGKISLRAPAASPAHGLHDLAVSTQASLIVIGSTRTGAIGRVLPGSTGEKLLHGAPCAIAVVPRGYAAQPVRRIGVAYDGSPEAKAALDSAVNLARAFDDAELELIGVAASDWYTGPVLTGGIGSEVLREEIEQQVEQSLAAAAADLPVLATTVLRSGDPADELAARSAELDLLITGSRGYGPLRSVVTGGVSGRVIRSAQCPVIVVPRGAEAALTTHDVPAAA
jgi:nucleotide-binding universal stress UspA family protein